MAIQPIDLQALFSQVDKVGKNQAVIREGQQLNDALQQAHIQRKLEQNVQSVNQAQNMGDEAETIKDENRRGANTGHSEAKGNSDGKEESNPEEESQAYIRDPALGRNLDISG